MVGPISSITISFNKGHFTQDTRWQQIAELNKWQGTRAWTHSPVLKREKGEQRAEKHKQPQGFQGTTIDIPGILLRALKFLGDKLPPSLQNRLTLLISFKHFPVKTATGLITTLEQEKKMALTYYNFDYSSQKVTCKYVLSTNLFLVQDMLVGAGEKTQWLGALVFAEGAGSALCIPEVALNSLWPWF